MKNSDKQPEGAGKSESNNVTNGRDTGLGRDPKREKLPVEDEQEILKSQKGKKVDGNPYDNESDRPAE
jgi:hypothetical protein